MLRTSWMNGEPIQVNAVYSVSGTAAHPRFPYVDAIESLREAISIAKTYEGHGAMDGAGRVQRCLNVFYPGDPQGRHLSYRTHEWHVYADGTIKLSGWGGNFNRRPRSPGNRLADAIQGDAQHAMFMQEAAQRDLKNLTPAAYNEVVSIVLKGIVHGARRAGFRYVYFHQPEFREIRENLLATAINESLAHSGFRTLDDTVVRGVLKDVQTLESDMKSGIVPGCIEASGCLLAERPGCAPIASGVLRQSRDL